MPHPLNSRYTAEFDQQKDSTHYIKISPGAIVEYGRSSTEAKIERWNRSN